MSNIKHTPEPWVHVSHQTENKALVQSGDGRHLAELWTLDKKVNCSANAKRIVECVNACAGIDDVSNLKVRIDVLKQQKDLAEIDVKFMREQRDELLEALKVCHASLCTYGSHPIIDKHVEVVLSKVKGEKL